MKTEDVAIRSYAECAAEYNRRNPDDHLSPTRAQQIAEVALEKIERALLTKHRKINTPKAMTLAESEKGVIVARLHKNTTKTAAGCWEWNGARDHKGYGQLKVGKRAQWTHRLAYACLVGDIPPDMTVHHTCANTCCWNPEHLQLLSKAENSKERWARSRA